MNRIQIRPNQNDLHVYITQNENAVTIHGPKHPRGKVILASEKDFAGKVNAAVEAEKKAVQEAIGGLEAEAQKQFDEQQTGFDQNVAIIIDALS